MTDYQNGSFSGDIYLDRRDAGRRLGEELRKLAETRPVVLGLARGGMVVADEVARRLDAELDVIVVRKLGAPYSEELAIGAVTANGGIFVSDEAMRITDTGRAYLEHVIARQKEAARTREERYRKAYGAPSLADRNVILIDDGLATGASMIAAARSARSYEPASITIAVPVAAPESCQEIGNEADDVVCPMQPRFFGAVGRFYHDFSEVSDEEVESILSGARSRTAPRR